jgi:hypothetical protein
MEVVNAKNISAMVMGLSGAKPVSEDTLNILIQPSRAIEKGVSGPEEIDASRNTERLG